MARFQAAPVWAAYEAQRDLLRAWLGGVPDNVWSRPSVLEAWTVLELAVHVANVAGSAARILDAGAGIERPLSLGEYTAGWAASAEGIAAIAVEAAEGRSVSDVLQVWDNGNAAMAAVAGSVPDDLVVTAQRGPLRVGDYLATRVNELVVHAGDLSRSVPEIPPVPVDRKALAVTCRLLTTILADRNPGHTLEVRVPPYAAVQCV